MIQILIQNDDPYDNFVTVVDQNTNPYTTVMNNVRINAGAAPVAVGVEEDGSPVGLGNVQWNATRCDDNTQVGAGNATPAAGETVHVSSH